MCPIVTLVCLSDIIDFPYPLDISAPLQPTFSQKCPISAVLSWTAPTESTCATMYTITLTNITEGNTSYTYNATTNTTSITLSDLTQGAEYFFTVAGVDEEGRVGEESVPSQTVMLKGQCLQRLISNINRRIVLYTSGLPTPLQPTLSPCKCLTSADLSWIVPAESICVIMYTITLTSITDRNSSYSYNTSTNTTNITVSGLTQGAEYFFTVAGVDAEGRVWKESAPSQTAKIYSKYMLN